MTNSVELTERQLQVLRMFAEGYSYKDISNELNVSPTAIQAVKSGIIAKLAAINITHAVAKAIKTGVLGIE